MAFATSVELYPAPAVQGDRANQNPTIYTAHNFLTAAPTTVGQFVWRDSTLPAVACNVTGSGAPLGIVERTHENAAEAFNFDASLAIPAKNNVSVIEKGQVWVVADTTVTVGMKAFATLADGTIQFAAAGATVTGAVETAWTAVTAGAADDLVIVDSYLG